MNFLIAMFLPLPFLHNPDVNLSYNIYTINETESVFLS